MEALPAEAITLNIVGTAGINGVDGVGAPGQSLPPNCATGTIRTGSIEVNQ